MAPILWLWLCSSTRSPFQMEMARRSTQGTVAEVLGKDFVKFDKDIRRNYWPDAIRAQIAALSQRICPFCKATLME